MSCNGLYAELFSGLNQYGSQFLLMFNYNKNVLGGAQ